MAKGEKNRIEQLTNDGFFFPISFKNKVLAEPFIERCSADKTMKP